MRWSTRANLACTMWPWGRWLAAGGLLWVNGQQVVENDVLRGGGAEVDGGLSDSTPTQGANLGDFTSSSLRVPNN